MVGEGSAAVRVHRRQFVVGPEPFRVSADWVCRRLDPSIFLSHCPELPVRSATDADGSEWVLLGLAAQTLEPEPDPLVAIASVPSGRVAGLYASWAGRWVLLGRGEVHMDASGQLGCFFDEGPEGGTWVSSSPALLLRLLSAARPLAADHRKLRHEVGLSWYTPPRSRFDGMARLLPSQVLELRSGKTRPRPLMPRIELSRPYEETLDLLMESLVTPLRRLPAPRDELWMSQSAGGDSRLVLAAAHLAGIRMRLVTRISGRMSLGDLLLPPKLACELGYEHVTIKPAGRMRERWRLVSEHAAGHVSDGDAEPFVAGARDALAGIMLGGWGFGVGKVLERDRLPPTFADPDQGARQLGEVYGEPVDSSARAGIRDWLAWVQKTPQVNLDWRDRFYIEQRMAGWQSSKEQVYDMTRLERFPVLNAARSYSLLLSLDERRRHGLGHHRDLIQRSVPDLLKYPINPLDRDFGWIRRTWIRLRLDPASTMRRLAQRSYRILRRRLGARPPPGRWRHG